MPNDAPDRLKYLKLTVTGVAVLGLVVRLAFPELRIDAVSLGLLALSFLPWLSPLIKSAELPGGIKIEFQDVKQAAEKVAAGEPAAAATAAAIPAPEPAFLAISEQDPNLALVGLRIEIERRLRTLADRVGVVKNGPLLQLTRELEKRGVLAHEATSGLRDLITLGNQAAHGVEVASDVAYSSVEYGPQVLRILDAKLAEYGSQA